MRVIDADALTDAIEYISWYHISSQGTLADGANSQLHTPLYKADDIYQAIKDAPTIDAELVKHGQWEKVIPSKSAAKWSNKMSCSICHKQGYTYYNYCPSCGAKMEVE